jgi:hydroxyacylglutathione hydrolase
MSLELYKIEVGPWPMNSYVVVCPETAISAIIDPGADEERILEKIALNRVAAILLTHGHLDHIGALERVKSATGAPVYLHPMEAEHFNLVYDIPFQDGMIIGVGTSQVRAVHTPGHTPGMTSLDLGDGRVLVGDTLFVGGPGRTGSPEDFTITMRTLQDILFTWPDETVFFPGHGVHGTIGEERSAFEAFVERGWPSGLYGDVTWE